MSRVEATAELVEERVRLKTEDGHDVVVWRSWRPDRARERGGVSSLPAAILCHGFIQNRFAFDGKTVSMTAHLRDIGLCVHAIELRGRSCGDKNPHCFAEYVEQDAPAVVRFVREQHERVAWIGHSMGGLVGVSLDEPLRREIACMVAVGVPLVPGFHPFEPRRLARAGLLVTRALADKGVPFRGKRYGRALHRLSLLLDHPIARFPMQVWAPGSLDREDLAFALSESFADDSYGAFNDLVELALTGGERAGRVAVGERVRALRAPLLVVGADRDGLAPMPATRPLYERAGSVHKEFLEVSARTTGHPVGHVDLLVGKRAPYFVWPHVDAFLERHLLAG